MCGLYASIGFQPEPGRLDIVAHRGPDGRGWEEYASPQGKVALGHRRLAIIDTSDAGRQPLATSDGRYSLVFNGEIYNYVELREDLRRAGVAFKTKTDSEVLLQAYVTWGEAALPRLKGMFAFIIWDDVGKRLFAARDRFGIKPLYFAANSSGIAFGSEIKQLLGLPGVSRRMNIPRVHDFLWSGIADHTGQTMFIDVSQLRNGEYVSFDAAKATEMKLQPARWYAPPGNKAEAETEKVAAGLFRQLLRDSVRLHLRSDVPVGSCLSGGLDSSAIVCLATDMLKVSGATSKFQTVSACYAEKSVDEKQFVDRVVDATNSNPTYVYPSADEVFAQASDVTWHQDEPFGSTSIFAQWCVFEAARKAGIKVMLDGQGADEQLAGYHGLFHNQFAQMIRSNRWFMVARTVFERRMWHGLPIKQQLQNFVRPYAKPALAKYLPASESQATLPGANWLGSELLKTKGNPKGAMHAALEASGLPAPNDVATFCHVMTHGFSLQLLLHYEDRNSMAHSVEARVPFLDHELVEFSLALGNRHKLVGGDTKRVLRRAMQGILPETIRKRRDKLGFATPEQIWFRGPLRKFVEKGVEETLRRFPELFDVGEARMLCAAMLDGQRPLDFTLWRIINLGIWGERFSVTI